MDWLKDMLRQYAPAAGGATPVSVEHDPRTVESDFDRFTEAGDRDDIAEGLAAAFRSDRTPPFAAMLAQLFGRSSGPQRAQILNTLASVLGPAILGQVLGRRGVTPPAGGAAPVEVTPEMAQQVPPEVVKEAAEQAEQRDPSIVDRLSRVYAEQPALIKTLGAAALAIALGKVAQRRGTL
jgi:hypothetical protein